MSVKCPTCGSEQSDARDFCAVCGGEMLGSAQSSGDDDMREAGYCRMCKRMVWLDDNGRCSVKGCSPSLITHIRLVEDGLLPAFTAREKAELKSGVARLKSASITMADPAMPPARPGSPSPQSLRSNAVAVRAERARGVKEYKRTCRKCGAMWFLPKELAEEKVPADRKIKGARLATLGTGFMWGMARHSQTQVASFEAQKQRVIENGRCKSCGSSDYIQAKDW